MYHCICPNDNVIKGLVRITYALLYHVCHVYSSLLDDEITSVMHFMNMRYPFETRSSLSKDYLTKSNLSNVQQISYMPKLPENIPVLMVLW